jgi:hypothetical protein
MNSTKKVSWYFACLPTVGRPASGSKNTVFRTSYFYFVLGTFYNLNPIFSRVIVQFLFLTFLETALFFLFGFIRMIDRSEQDTVVLFSGHG